MIRTILRFIPTSVKSFVRAHLREIPALSWLAAAYLDTLNGENNSNMLTNGELKLLKQIAFDLQTVLDVGVNRGEWTTILRGLNPNVIVHCFEPTEAAFAKLSIALRGTNVELNHVALGSEQKTSQMWIFGQGAGVNSLHRRSGLSEYGYTTEPSTEIVNVTTLDSYVKNRMIPSIDLLKLDVEDHELEVLKGAADFLPRIQRIQFEYGGANIDSRVLLADLIDYLSGFGFTIYLIRAGSLTEVPSYDPRMENFQYKNFLATRVRPPKALLSRRRNRSAC